MKKKKNGQTRAESPPDRDVRTGDFGRFGREREREGRIHYIVSVQSEFEWRIDALLALLLLAPGSVATAGV